MKPSGNNSSLRRISTITEYHRLRGLPKPEHPLVSLVNYAAIKHSPENNNSSWVHDFYLIALKRNFNASFKYGQQEYDFDEGVLFFIAPGQVFSIQATADAPDKSGWMLLIHPDFLWDTPLAKTIKRYEYFGYAVNEALFLSDKEEMVITGILQNIQQEYHANIDKFSQQIIISQIEVLLNYADRFYHRQFITRKVSGHQVLTRLENLLDAYFSGDAMVKGLPTVQYIAEQLHLSPDYLSTLLKVSTGLNTQQHIHEKLIEKAKEKLSATNLSVSEIACELGFEHAQSFSKLFKTKTNVSPLTFRQSFQ
ncbi:helix-turn-helix domain-containing protein [Deminuibacter soli]|uniref:AraC family transcriptional regulator n=1 Tax=Deminuibacter soli TaxID=2291815 RepID=A0A3E1NEZ8_9BACT|nr:AraC family transcriptional regulator [Deminuibacter soli]RFM26442.1 AraC family transcriptional regulator [Deminuibacter soli]